MEEKRKSQLLMVRKSMERMPPVELPEGYRVRSFLPGDEPAWERIIEGAFGWKNSFQDSMANDAAFKPDRVLFICERNGIPVATASAWFRPPWSEDTGYLHMVGVLPEHAGQRLGLAVSLAALQQLARDGRNRAVLHTDDFRLPAIRTYLKLDFVPELADTDHLDRWTAIAAILNRRLDALDAQGRACTIPDHS